MTDPAIRPEPVLDSAKLAGATAGMVTAVGAALVLVGLATDGTVSAWASIAGGVVTSGSVFVAALTPYIQAMKARKLVTPLASPVNEAGVPLVPADASPLGPR